MEKAKLNRRESSVSRVVKTKDEELFLQAFKDIFEKQQFFSAVPEKEKSPLLQELIKNINDYMGEFIVQYGTTPVDIKDKHIHFVDRSKATESMKEEIDGARARGVQATFFPQRQGVIIWEGYEEDEKLELATGLVHEMFHFNSFHAYEKSEDLADKRPVDAEICIQTEGVEKDILLRGRRSGLKVFAKEKDIYFKILDEAVIEELTIRFSEEYFPQIDILSKELEKENQQTRDLSLEVRRKFISRYAYDHERESLHDLIDDVYEKNKDSFESREDVFNVFAKAVLGDRLLPLARLIEKTYGKGSFRGLGKKTVDSARESLAK
ncbi:hypothetical protein MYX07_03865 [Patescibacteria group bacterium AH-259-L07]|nr:hypothetical protein [Patescibacteria group bacterium AH-259-L07]